jgi:hypothetical protein
VKVGAYLTVCYNVNYTFFTAVYGKQQAVGISLALWQDGKYSMIMGSALNLPDLHRPQRSEGSHVAFIRPQHLEPS